MVTELRLYFEGDKLLKPGFHQFLTEIVENARARRCYFHLIATGGTPIQDYRDAVKTHSQAYNVLLLDYEGPEGGREKSIEPRHADSVFWMVQIMESWFLADTEALSAYFGQSVQKGNPKVEEIPKTDVMARLLKASGGKYHKVKDGVRLLERVHPAKVRQAAPNCERMFRVILEKFSED